MKFNIEPLKGFPLSNDQKETLLGLIKKMCDENNSSKPAQANEPIQITVYPNPNSSNEWYVSTRFGTTFNQYTSIGDDKVLSLYTSDNELFEYVEKNILNCGFELNVNFDPNNEAYLRTNQYVINFVMKEDGSLDENNCDVCFKIELHGIGMYVKISIQKS